MTAETFMKNTNYLANRATLKYLVKTTKQIIIMSANVSKSDIDWIHSMRPTQESIELNTSTVVITNTYIPESRKINISSLQVLQDGNLQAKCNQRPAARVYRDRKIFKDWLDTLSH